MGDSILSQAEIDALLNGDSQVKDEPTSGVTSDNDIRPYDPYTQRRVVRERLQALEIITERFARHFRMGLFNLLRRSPDITVGRSVSSHIMNLPATCRCRPTLTLST